MSYASPSWFSGGPSPTGHAYWELCEREARAESLTPEQKRFEGIRNAPRETLPQPFDLARLRAQEVAEYNSPSSHEYLH